MAKETFQQKGQFRTDAEADNPGAQLGKTYNAWSGDQQDDNSQGQFRATKPVKQVFHPKSTFRTGEQDDYAGKALDNSSDDV